MINNIFNYLLWRQSFIYLFSPGFKVLVQVPYHDELNPHNCRLSGQRVVNSVLPYFDTSA